MATILEEFFIPKKPEETHKRLIEEVMIIGEDLSNIRLDSIDE